MLPRIFNIVATALNCSTMNWRNAMRLTPLLWSIIFLVLPIAAMAQDSKEVLVKELYVKSGLEKQMGQLPMLVQAGYDQAVAADDNLREMPQSDIREIRASIETVFAPEKIQKTIMNECREKLSIEDLKKVIEWLDSPVGRKFTRLEEIASTPEKYDEMLRYAQKLQESPPAPERLEIMKQLDAAVKATKTTVEIAMNTQLAVAMAVVASLPKEQQPGYDTLADTIKQTRPQLESAMRTQTIYSMLYSYRSATNEELSQYIAFASSPAGQIYHDVTISGAKKAMMAASYKWGEVIADILNQNGGKADV